MQRFDDAEDYLKWIASNDCNVRTERDQAVAYSGGTRREETHQTSNHRLAEQHCHHNGGTIIDRTEGGKELGSHDLYGRFNDQDAKKIMGAISEKFAREASGSVTAFVNGAEPDRVFREKELPAFLANPDVTEINGYDRKDLALEPSKAFERIQQGQLLIEDKRQIQEPQQKIEPEPPAAAREKPQAEQPQRPAYKPLPWHTAEDHARHTQQIEKKRQEQPQPQLKPEDEIRRGL